MPVDWSEITLGDFVSLQRGHGLTEPERRVGRVPVMGSIVIGNTWSGGCWAPLVMLSALRMEAV